MEDFDDEEWAEMQEMYVNHTFKELQKVKENINETSIDSLRTFGHNIKGSGGMYGFDKINNLILYKKIFVNISNNNRFLALKEIFKYPNNYLKLKLLILLISPISLLKRFNLLNKALN